jgi:AcrR family transcriptional regulator
MSRTIDERARARLLERVTDYVLVHGIADLSLRPLAKAVRSSARMLLYYFESKERLVADVLKAARARQQRQFARLQEQAETSVVDACRAIWAVMSAPKAEAAFRLFFETYALAVRDPARFPGFVRSAIEDWLRFIEEPQVAAGHTRADARAFATVVLAGYRGFLLDLIATHDRARIDRAVELWLRTLAAAPSPKELAHHERRSAS